MSDKQDKYVYQPGNYSGTTPFEFNLRLMILVRLGGPRDISIASGKSVKQLMRYGPDSPMPSDVIATMFEISRVSAEWIMRGKVERVEDLPAHDFYLEERVAYFEACEQRLPKDLEHPEMERLYKNTKAELAEARMLLQNFRLSPQRALPEDQTDIAQPGEGFQVPILDVRLAAGAGSLNTDAMITTYMTLDPEIMRQIGRSTTKGLVIMEAEGASNEPLIRDGAPILIDELDTQIKEGHMYAFRLGDNLRIKRLRFNVTDIEAVSENPLFPPEIIPYDMRDQFQILGRAIWTFTRL